MKAAVYHAPYRLSVEEIPTPTAGPDDVVVKVEACGTCGSDLHGYRAGLWVEPGEVMGHEWAGEVAEIGANIRYVKVGDRVAVGDFHGGRAAPRRALATACRAPMPSTCASPTPRCPAGSGRFPTSSTSTRRLRWSR